MDVGHMAAEFLFVGEYFAAELANGRQWASLLPTLLLLLDLARHFDLRVGSALKNY